MSISEPVTHDRRCVSTAVHRGCTRFLSAGITRPTVGQIVSITSEDPAFDRPHVYRLAARQQTITAIAVYFASFALDWNRWRFVGHEVALAAAHGALLFEDRAGRLLLDKLVLDSVDASAEPRSLTHMQRHLREARELYGPRLLSYRAIFLRVPQASRLLSWEGEQWRLVAQR